MSYYRLCFNDQQPYDPRTYAAPVNPPTVYPPTVYPPHGYTAQARNSSAYSSGMQPVPYHTVQMRPAQPPPVPQQWIGSDRHTSHRHRYESEDFEADGYPAPQGRPNFHSRTYGRYSTPLEQPHPPRKAIEYQDQDQEDDAHVCHSDYSTATSTHSEEVIEARHDYCRKPKTSTRSRRDFTMDDSSQPEHVQRYIGSQPIGADEYAKGSSANRAGNERKHAMNQSTRTQLPKPNSKRRPEEPSEQRKERTSTNTASTERAHSTSHSSRTNAPFWPMEFQTEPDVNIRLPAGSSMRITRDNELVTIPPAENSSGRSIKRKSKESSRGNQGKEGNNKMAGKSSQSSRGNDGNNENADSKLVEKASRVLKDELSRKYYNQRWLSVCEE